MNIWGDKVSDALVIFVVGFILGMVIVGLLTLTVVQSKANDPQQLSPEEIQIWMDDLELQMEGIITKTKKAQATLITLDVFAREWVWTIRDEIDDWNRAGGQ